MNDANFENNALALFQYQAKNNPVYNQYLSLMKCNIKTINSLYKIPFLPISFFKSHKVVTGTRPIEKVFLSSGTTQSIPSRHYIHNLSVYTKSLIKCFAYFYGPVDNYCFMALLPEYNDQSDSSLVYMAKCIIDKTNHPLSGFYLKDLHAFRKAVAHLEKTGEKGIILGTSNTLLDLLGYFQQPLNKHTIIETGGMKGKRTELTKVELHHRLKKAFSVTKVHSEYGMTELLSQAYSLGGTIFTTPPWMAVMIRDINDPLKIVDDGRIGGINVIDLANMNSCSFIATDDLGRVKTSAGFELLGRLDQSDIRGCNLLTS